MFGKVAETVARSLLSAEGTAVAYALARESAALKFARYALKLAEHIADLSGAHADVAGGNVSKLTHVPVEFRHKALAKTHNLGFGLALGVEVRAALASAHWEGCESVFKGLLKAQKLHNRGVYTRMKTNTPLIGAYGGVKLHPKAAVDSDVALIVQPGNPEAYKPVGLYKPFEYGVLFIFGVGL